MEHTEGQGGVFCKNKYATHSMLCQNCCWTPFQNFMS